MKLVGEALDALVRPSSAGGAPCRQHVLRGLPEIFGQRALFGSELGPRRIEPSLPDVQVTSGGQTLLPGVVRHEGSDLALEAGGQTLWVRNCPPGHYELVRSAWRGGELYSLRSEDGVHLALETNDGSARPHSFSRFVWEEGGVPAVALARLISGGADVPLAILYGQSGVGKTHLLHAVANATSSDEGVVSVTAERLMNNFVGAIRSDRMPDFREKYRGADLLLLDGLEFLPGKDATQGELLRILQDLEYYGARVLCTSSVPVQELELAEGLKAFLLGAVAFPLPLLGIEGRKLLLQR